MTVAASDGPSGLACTARGGVAAALVQCDEQAADRESDDKRDERDRDEEIRIHGGLANVRTPAAAEVPSRRTASPRSGEPRVEPKVAREAVDAREPAVVGP